MAYVCFYCFLAFLLKLFRNENVQLLHFFLISQKGGIHKKVPLLKRWILSKTCAEGQKPQNILTREILDQRISNMKCTVSSGTIISK